MMATYTVKSGDTLSEIAEEFHTSMDEIVTANEAKYAGLRTDPDTIEVGWELTIPGTAEPVKKDPGSPTPTSQRYVADESFSREPAATLVSTGYSGLIGYCSHDSAKNLSSTHIQLYRAAGLDVGLVWETGGQRASEGTAAGESDAHDFVAQAKGVGATGGCLYMVAEDPTRQPSSEWPNMDAYFQAAGPILSQAGFAIGGYGSEDYLVHAKAQGHIDRQWLVGGWSANIAGDLVQQSNNPGLSTLDSAVDCNLVVNDGDWGWANFG